MTNETTSNEPHHDNRDSHNPDSFRDKLHEIIFGADTPAGIWFDIALLIAILVSVTCVCLATVESIDRRWNDWFYSNRMDVDGFVHHRVSAASVLRFVDP